MTKLRKTDEDKEITLLIHHPDKPFFNFASCKQFDSPFFRDWSCNKNNW